MTLITPPPGLQLVEDELARLVEALTDFRKDLEDLNRRVRAGEEDAAKQAQRHVREIPNWIRSVADAEMKLAERQKKEAGIVHNYALDLDDARSKIGCRLDRLRRTRCKGCVPG